METTQFAIVIDLDRTARVAPSLLGPINMHKWFSISARHIEVEPDGGITPEEKAKKENPFSAQ